MESPIPWEKKHEGTLLVLPRAEGITYLIGECREGMDYHPFSLLEFLSLLFFKYEDGKGQEPDDFIHMWAIKQKSTNEF